MEPGIVGGAAAGFRPSWSGGGVGAGGCGGIGANGDPDPEEEGSDMRETQGPVPAPLAADAPCTTIAKTKMAM
jgi:hypothetical protein